MKSYHFANVELHCRSHFHPVNGSCRRYLRGALTLNGGLGHQITELVFFVRLATQLQTTFVYDPFTSQEGDHKDTYKFAGKLFGLDGLAEHFKLPSTPELPWMLSTNKERKCDVIIETNLAGCSQQNCFFSEDMRFAFESLAKCFRATSLAYGNGFKVDVLPKETLNIAWHVRVGDINLHEDDQHFYQNVMELLSHTVESFPTRIYLIGGSSKERTGSCDEYDGECYERRSMNGTDVMEQMVKLQKQLLPHASVLSPPLSVREALIMMMQSDILVGSGSSFPQLGTLFSDRPLYFFHEPKHGWNQMQEFLSDAVLLNTNGTTTESVDSIRTRLHGKSQFRKFAQSAFQRN